MPNILGFLTKAEMDRIMSGFYGSSKALRRPTTLYAEDLITSKKADRLLGRIMDAVKGPLRQRTITNIYSMLNQGNWRRDSDTKSLFEQGFTPDRLPPDYRSHSDPDVWDRWGRKL